MRNDHDTDASLLVGYLEAATIVGGIDALNEFIARGALAPIRLNDRPGAPSMFPRSLLERVGARSEGMNGDGGVTHKNKPPSKLEARTGHRPRKAERCTWLIYTALRTASSRPWYQSMLLIYVQKGQRRAMEWPSAARSGPSAADTGAGYRIAVNRPPASEVLPVLNAILRSSRWNRVSRLDVA